MYDCRLALSDLSLGHKDAAETVAFVNGAQNEDVCLQWEEAEQLGPSAALFWWFNTDGK